MQRLRLGFMGLLTTQNILDDIDFAINNGFNAFEISLDWIQNFNIKDEVIREIKEKAESANLFLIVHTPWYLPTASAIPEIQDAVFKVVSNGILLAEKVNTDRITVHPGFREMPMPARDRVFEALIKTMKRIVKFGVEHDIKVGLENGDRNDYVNCFEVEDLLRVVNSVEELKVILDIGHTFTTDISPIEYYKRIKNFVIDVHIHDNDGKKDEHKCIGDGKIDFKSLFQEFKANNYHGPFILELFPYENILKGKERFLKIWKK